MSTVNCEMCGTELEAGSSGAVAVLLEKNIDNWVKFESDDVRWGQPVGSSFAVPGIGTVIVESKKIKPTMEDLADNFGYMEEDSYPQGTEFQVYVILRVGDSFYKKTGSADSYGDITWQGVVKPTKAKQVTVTAWE